MEIATNRNVDIINVSTTEEAINALKGLEVLTSADVKEIVSSVSLRGLSLIDTVRVYAKFTNESAGDKVICFENGKNKIIQRQLWREVA